MPWFIHSLLAVVAFGISSVLYKIPFIKGQSKYYYSLICFAVATVLSAIFLFEYIVIDARTIAFSAIWGFAYACTILLQMELLKQFETNTLFPLSSLSSHVLVVIIGFFFFKDQISLLQYVGIALTFIVIASYHQIRKIPVHHLTALWLGVLLIVISASAKTVQKLGSVSTEIYNFVFWQLFFTMIASGIIFLLAHRNELRETLISFKGTFKWSLAVGVLIVMGTTEMVKALSTGPFTLVYSINCFYVLITSLLAWKFFKEELTRRKVILLLVAIFAILLIGLG